MFEDPTVFFSMDFFLSLFSFFTASTLKNNPVLYIYMCNCISSCYRENKQNNLIRNQKCFAFYHHLNPL